ncbi:PLP-dependent aminotransferase family protein [Aequorivita sp. Q41]|uniref:aminotransferase-like domain-containing protein n=1 Tax=Aequorivita sp. Q41 TaxID=3153300 RepID=UPI0032420631
MGKDLLYVRIAKALEKQIKNKVLSSGDKLPSLRTIKEEYGVSMNTATQAFLELEKWGLIESVPRSGFYVSNLTERQLKTPETSNPSASTVQEEAEQLITKVYRSLTDTSITRLSLGVPDHQLVPIAKLNKSLIHSMRNLGGGGTDYEEIQGNRKLRKYIARWSFTWGGDFSEEDFVTTAGSMNAISFCLMALTKRGDTIAVESPIYFGILQLAKSLGLHVLEMPTHPVTGMDLQALKKVVPKIKVCLIVSNFSNPLGSCMPEAHKKELVSMLAAHDIPIIENDLYGDVYFGDSRPKPCKAFDMTGNVLWCGSVSKTLAPGYRVGWVAPGKYLAKINHLKLLHSVSSTTITQEAIAHFLENGRYENHLKKMRRTLATNSLHFKRAISAYFPENTKVSNPQGGFMLWVELDPKIDTATLYEKAMEHKISIAPGRMFTLQDQFHNCMRISYGQQWTAQLESKLKQLGNIAKRMF